MVLEYEFDIGKTLQNDEEVLVALKRKNKKNKFRF